MKGDDRTVAILENENGCNVTSNRRWLHERRETSEGIFFTNIY